MKMLIFDMDGVILDSEPLHMEAEHQILEEYGIYNLDLSWTVGISSYKMWQRFIVEYDMNTTPEALMQRQYATILSIIKKRNVSASYGLAEVMKAAKDKGLMLGVASSSDSVLVYGVLEHLKIKDEFDVIVCGDHVPEKKPAPFIYQEALRGAGITNEDAVTIEDSESGAEAARRAGVRCVGYRNPTSGNQDLSGTWKQIDSLSEVIPYL